MTSGFLTWLLQAGLGLETHLTTGSAEEVCSGMSQRDFKQTDDIFGFLFIII